MRVQSQAPSYNFLRDYEENAASRDSSSFRDRNGVGRVKQVLDKKGITDFLCEMYRD